jgi:putative ABC transport system permease protein
MNPWQLAARFLRADLRSGELRALLLSVGLAVTALTAVAFFTDRVGRGLERQGAHLLAADLALEHGRALGDAFTAEAERRGLRFARTMEFPSVVFHDDRPVLVQVKVVGPGYPLRGELRLGTGPATAPPPEGSAWVEQRLLTTLAAAIGGTLPLGEIRLRIADTIAHEPDRGGNLVRFAPRVLIGYADAERSGLLGPASRVKHRLLLAGDAAAVTGYQRWARQRLPEGTELLTIANARPELRVALERGGRFLGLAALCAVLLAGAAVALSTHLFVERQTDAAAVLRCLGLPGGRIFAAFALRLALLGLAASLAGSAAGYLAQFGLSALIGHWFGEGLPLPGPLPALHGLAIGLVLLLGFALPPLLRLRRVPPLRVLRRDLDPPPVAAWLAWGLAAGSMAALVLWQAGDLALAGRVLGGVAATVLLLALAARALLTGLRRVARRSRAAWAFGLATLARRPGLTALQAAGFGLGILALLLLAMVRVDLLSAWRDSLPADTPDHFMLNIQPDEVAELQGLLAAHGIANSGVYPMIRGRLTHIGERAVDPEDYDSPRARRLAAREFNLSHATEMQADNRLVAGQWWQASELDEPWFSVEQGLAAALGIRRGDSLRFDVAGQPVSGRVVSLRKVQWDSFNVNFFVIGTPGLMAGLPATFVTSFHLRPGEDALIGEIARRFPSASVLDVKPLLAQVRAVVNQGVRAVEAVFLFTLAAGMLVLFAAVQASRDERATETAVLRTLGAPRRRILGAALAEFGTLGLLSGTLASAAASAVGYVLATRVFELPWQLDLGLWATGAAIGAASVVLAGVAATYPLINTPPAQVLRTRLG